MDIKAFIGKCRRIWLVLKKPTLKEFKLVAKISVIGILLLGLMGFLIALIMKIFE